MRETILILGESNAGGYNSLSPPQVYPNASRIFICRGGPLRIEQASDPLIVGLNFGIGPGMACADEYLRLRNDPNLEICLMVGIGLHVVDWQVNSPSYVISAQAAVFCEENWGPVTGVIWTQGVNDAFNSQTAFPWPVYVRRVFANLRIHLSNPHLPIVVNGLPNKPASVDANWDLVQFWIDQLPVDVPCITTVEASDLAVNSAEDPYHFTAPSAVTLGRRDANALLGLLQ